MTVALKLTTTPTEPFWLDILPGVRVQLRPITVPMVLTARQSAGEAYRETPNASQHVGAAAITRSLVQQGLVAWEGVGDLDGNAIEPSPAAIDSLLAHVPAFLALDTTYVTPAFASGE